MYYQGPNSKKILLICSCLCVCVCVGCVCCTLKYKVTLPISTKRKLRMRVWHLVGKTENQFILTSVVTVKHSGWIVLWYNCLWKACDSVSIKHRGRCFVPNLHVTFPDSMSRASHVKSAKEPDGRRLTMAHTCREREEREKPQRSDFIKESETLSWCLNPVCSFNLCWIKLKHSPCPWADDACINSSRPV